MLKEILKILTITTIILLFHNLPAQALAPEPRLTNEADEQRAMNLFLQVRCLVCEGQVIESSSTEFAFEMRKFIRGKIAAGESDNQIKSELTKKFGEDILISTKLKSHFLLWLLPIVFLALCGFSRMNSRS